MRVGAILATPHCPGLYNSVMSEQGLPTFSKPIALFPLPNAVLLPGGRMPLQVFEDRYRQMLEDIMDEGRFMAIALLRPGYEETYFTNQADIHAVACVGRVEECVGIPDGRYLISIHGLCRARVRQEDRDGPYREAMLDPMMEPETVIETDGEFAARKALQQLLSTAAFDQSEEIDRIRALANSDRPLGDVVDRIASAMVAPDSFEIRQQLLEEMQASRRAEALAGELRLMARILAARQKRQNEWPRLGSMN